MSSSIFDTAQQRFPHPIADTVSGLNRAVSSHEKRDRIIEVFRTSIRLLCAYAIGVRTQFGEGPDGASQTLSKLMEGLRRRGLTDGQWVSILRELLREHKSAPSLYPIKGMVELFHKKNARFAQLTDALLVMRRSQTIAHSRVLDEEELLQVIDERLPQIEVFLTILAPIFDQFQLSIGTGSHETREVAVLHGLGSHEGDFPTLIANEPVQIEQLCLLNGAHEVVVFLHPSSVFRAPLPELPKEVFVFEKRGKSGATLLSLPNMYEIEAVESWDPIEQAFFTGESFEADPEIEGIERPYRGLASFQQQHAALFFGRNKEAEELTNRIRKNGFVVLTGPSGTGKSSLIQAGVAPQLQSARVHIMRPGSAPLHNLNQLLQGIVPDTRANELAEAVRNGDTSVVHSIIHNETSKHDRLTILVVDQGEELVTLCADVQTRERFGAILSELGRSALSNVRVVYSLREDFFGPVGVVDRMKTLFSRQVMVISTPTQEALMETLVGPASRFGYRFEDHSLLLEMVQAVKDEVAALALLQFCADKMWDNRDRHRKLLTWDSYHSLGRVAGALSQHAEDVFKSLPPLQQEQAKGIFLRLVTADRTKQLCTRTELIEAASDTEATEALLNGMLSARLLTSHSDGEQDAHYELVHDALITHWGRLRDWLAANQAGQRTLLALRQAAIEWKDRRKNRAVLWRDDLLEELRVFRRSFAGNLTQNELQFAMACDAAESKRKLVRRGLYALALVVVTAFSVFSYTQARRVELEQNRAVRKEEALQVEQLVAESMLLDSLGQKPQAFAMARVAHALQLDLQDRAAPQPEGAQLSSAGVMLAIFHQRAAGYHSKQFFYDAPIEPIAFTPDGTQVIVQTQSEPQDDSVSLWHVDRETGAVLRTLALPHAIHNVEFSDDGTRMMVATEEELFVVESASHTVLFRSPHRVDLNGDASDHKFYDTNFMNAAGTRVATIEGDAAIWWNVDKQQVLHRFENQPFFARLSADASQLFTKGLEAADPCDGYNCTLMNVWDPNTGQRLTSFYSTEFNGVEYADSLPGRNIIISHSARVMNLRDAVGQRLKEYSGDDYVNMVALSSDGTHLASAHSYQSQASTGSSKGYVPLFDTGKKEVVHRLAHEGEVYSVQFSPLAPKLLSAAADKTVRIWDVESGESDLEIATGIKTHHAKFSPHGLHFFSQLGSENQAHDGVGVFRYAGINPLIDDEGIKERIGSSYFDPDGFRLLPETDQMVIYSHYEMVVLGLKDQQILRHYKGQTDPSVHPSDALRKLFFREPQFLTERDVVLIGHEHNESRQWVLWNYQTGHEAAIEHSCDDILTDSNAVVCLNKNVQNDTVLRFIDVNTGQTQQPIPLKGAFHSLSPSGALIVSNHGDDLWLQERATGTVARRIQQPNRAEVQGVFLNDEVQPPVLATHSDDTVWVWDFETGKPLYSIVSSNQDTLLDVILSKDSDTIWTLTSGGLWRHNTTLNTQEHLLTLTPKERWYGERPFLSPTPNSRHLHVSYEGKHFIVDTVSGETVELAHDEMETVVFSEDGQYALTLSSEDKNARFWELKTGRNLHSYYDKYGFQQAVFSRDQSEIVFMNNKIEGGVSLPTTFYKVSAPITDSIQLLEETGRQTNLRVCPDQLSVVAVMEELTPDSVWAPKSSCGSTAGF